MIHIADFYKTFLALAGEPNATDQGGISPLDSVDVSDYLLGETETSARTFMVHDHFGSGNSATGAIREGDLKLLVGKQAMATWFGDFSPNTSFVANSSATAACADRPCLFNISSDPTEHHDLADVLPAEAARMLKVFESLDSDFHPPSPKGSDEDGYCSAAAKHRGFMVPWRSQPATGIDGGFGIGNLEDPLLAMVPGSPAHTAFVSGGEIAL